MSEASARIEAIIERGSYLSALAAILAERIIAETRPQDYLDPEESATLLAALTLILRDRVVPEVVKQANEMIALTGGAVLSPELVDHIIEDQITQGLATIDERLTAAVGDLHNYLARLEQYGLDPKVIDSVMTSDEGAKALLQRVTSVFRQGASGIASGVELALLEASQTQANDVSADETRWTWITAADGNVCSSVEEVSCEPRHGIARTLDAWASVGLPKAPNLICSIYSRSGISNCRCFLAEENTAIAQGLLGEGPYDVSKAVTRGRKRARNAA